MKTKNIIILSAAILLVVGGVVAARAHSRAFGMGFHHGRGFERGMAMLAWKLDLNDAQRAQVKSMFKSEWPTVQPIVQQLATEQNQMFEATKNGNFDEAKVKQIADQQSQAIAQLLVVKERFISQVYKNVLNPEQRTKADAIRQEWEQRINKRLEEHSSAQPNSEK
ncbi:MAG: Spy/CpxP family protein refolding chaperone [Candidatus Acidiferrales bacterium]